METQPAPRTSDPADGGPAFPRTGEGFGNPRYDEPGMSLRDWFAGQALAVIGGMYAEGAAEIRDQNQVANMAYTLADAMLAERGRS